MFAIDHAATALLIKRRYPSVAMTPLLLSVRPHADESGHSRSRHSDHAAYGEGHQRISKRRKSVGNAHSQLVRSGEPTMEAEFWFFMARDPNYFFFEVQQRSDIRPLPR